MRPFEYPAKPESHQLVCRGRKRDAVGYGDVVVRYHRVMIWKRVDQSWV